MACDRIVVHIAKRYLKSHLLERISMLAAETDRSISYHILRAISEYLDRNESTKLLDDSSELDE
ncbi:MAG: ribbon-helix-helix protein, CopG family [Parcubacteria group bacterium]